jgi:hypothetical protein
METTNQKRQLVKIYVIELIGPINTLLLKRYKDIDKDGVYTATFSLDEVIKSDAYYKSKKAAMFSDGQYLESMNVKFRILSFTVIKPQYYDLKEL